MKTVAESVGLEEVPVQEKVQAWVDRGDMDMDMEVNVDVESNNGNNDVPTSDDTPDKATAAPPRKKKTIRELLEALPNYKKISELKPTLSKGSTDFVELTIEDDNSKAGKQWSKNGKSKPDSKVQKLMDRFVKHTMVPKKPKEEHFNIQVHKKIEDSQGVEKDIVENFDYVAHNDENGDGTNARPATQSPTGKSPRGLNCTTLREQLLTKIRAKKKKEYEEKVKAFTIYNEEKCPEDKDIDEEIEEDVSTSGESEPDETDEEALEEYWREKDSKKKGKKLIFVDEEAEEVDCENENDENIDGIGRLKGNAAGSDDDDDESGTGDDGEEDDEVDEDEELKNENEVEDEAEKIQPKPSSRKSRALLFEDSDEDSNEAPIPSPQPKLNLADFTFNEEPVANKNVRTQPADTLDELENDKMEEDIGNFRESISLGAESSDQIQSSSQWLTSAFELKDTTPEILLRGLGLRAYGRRNQDQDETVSSQPSPTPVLGRTNSEQAFDAFAKVANEILAGHGVGDKTDAMDDIPISDCASQDDIEDRVNNKMLVPPLNMVSDSPRFTQDDDAMLDLCSAKFPTQRPVTPQETQYSNFDFSESGQDINCDEDDEGHEEGVTGSSFDNAHTPVQTKNSSVPCQNNDTPKLTDKISKSRILFRDRDAEEKEKSDGEDSAKGSAKGSSQIDKKKFSRIQFMEEHSDDEDEFVHVPKNTLAQFTSDSESESDDDVADEDNDADDDEEGERPPKPFKAFKTKRGQIRRDLVENEAELSGSEESSDEDEGNLDGDVEDLVNDDEKFDEDEVRAQIEKAHLKQVIDDDQRQVRILQNLYLEDGDLHGDGNVRQKVFTWGNLDMNDDDARMDGGEEGVEDDADLRWQQEHLDKIKWMNDNPQFQKKEEDEDENSHSLMKIVKESSQACTFGIRKNTMRRIESFVSFSQESMSMLNDSEEALNNSERSGTSSKVPFSKDAPSPMSPKSKQLSSSFLKRGSPFLSKIAGLSKNGELSLAGSKVNSRNFVFSVRSPSEKEKAGTAAADPSEEHKNKRKAKTPAKFQPKKIAKVDNAASRNSNGRKSTSVFKWMKT